MPNFAANLSMMFTEYPFLDRFAAAAKAKFKAVEYLFPYEYPPELLAAKLKEHDLAQALFNLPPGDWAAGERGIAALPGREAEFAASVDMAIRYATFLGNAKVHAMAGLIPKGADQAEMERAYLGNIKSAAQKLARHGLSLCLEPINHRSMPGYFLHRQNQAAGYIERMGEPNVMLQFDFFHVQMEEGCVTERFREFFPIIGHCQIAGVPDRHEPDSGELCYNHLLSLMDAMEYDGFVGCEYTPAGRTEDGLGWLAAYEE